MSRLVQCLRLLLLGGTGLARYRLDYNGRYKEQVHSCL